MANDKTELDIPDSLQDFFLESFDNKYRALLIRTYENGETAKMVSQFSEMKIERLMLELSEIKTGLNDNKKLLSAILEKLNEPKPAHSCACKKGLFSKK